MILSNVFGKLAKFRNVITRGASFETSAGERQLFSSVVKELFGHTAQDSGRRVIGVVDTGAPGVIFTGDFVAVDQAETSVIQAYSGIVIDTGVPGPPGLINAEIVYANPVTGDTSRQWNTCFFVDKDGATGDESLMLWPRNNGRLSAINLPVYADDAAAGAGGELAGVVYQTATGELRVKL